MGANICIQDKGMGRIGSPLNSVVKIFYLVIIFKEYLLGNEDFYSFSQRLERRVELGGKMGANNRKYMLE